MALLMVRKNPRRNISRIETRSAKGKVYGGWEVRMQRRGIKTEKFFSDSVFGGNRSALDAAKSFRDEIEAAGKKLSVRERARTPSTRNKSGTVGVRKHKQIDIRGEYEYHYWYWIAQWTDGLGRRRTRSFSVQAHGERKAYRLACEARRQGVKRANR